MKISFKAKFALFIAITLWASAFVAIRAGLQDYSPGGMALFRFLVASLCMTGIYMRFGHHKVSNQDKIYLLLVGAIGVGGYNIALNYGELTVPSGIASFIVSQSPILTTIFAIIFLNERFNLSGVIGMLISLCGITLILIAQNHDFQPRIGWFYMLFATVISAMYSILQKKFLKKYHAIDVTTYAIWGSTLVLLFFIPNLIHDVTTASLDSTMTVIYLGIFPAAIAYAAWNYALSELPVARTVNFLNFMPVLATLLGWLILDEVITPLALLGGLTALVGVFIVNKSFHVKNLQKNVDL